MLEEYKGLYVANYLSYKSNPLVAIYFIKQLHEEGIDTIAVHDPNIFHKEVIKLFINAGFHFILIEVNEVNTRFRINEFTNNQLKSNHHFKFPSDDWKMLKTIYRKALDYNENVAKTLNGLLDDFENKHNVI